MRIVFVYPRFNKYLDDVPEELHDVAQPIIGEFTTPPSLGIPILSALTPAGHDIEVVDDNRGDPVDFGIEADLIAINCFTPQATRALALADGYRAAGHTVVMGGIFPTAMHRECLEHADAVNVGEGERTWPRILADAEAGQLQRVYRGGAKLDLDELPIPRRDALHGKEGYDWHAALVQIARGCGFSCSMCTIPSHFGYRERLRSPQHIVEEIEQLPYDQIYLADDTLFLENRRVSAWARELLEALIPLKRRLFVASTPALNCDPGFLELLARAGGTTFYCTLNVDPVSLRALRGDDDRAVARVADLVQRVEELGMHFYASFAVGRDWDDESIGDRVLELSRRAGIHTAEFFVFTPFPGSPEFDRMASQGRLLHRDWQRYNGANVVSRPAQMSPERLEGLFHDLWRDFYRDRRDDRILRELGKDTSVSPHPDAGRPARAGDD